MVVSLLLFYTKVTKERPYIKRCKKEKLYGYFDFSVLSTLQPK